MPDSSPPRDVDEVLSSIRRLVSDEAAERGARAAPAGTDRLILTPALRVTTPRDAVASGRGPASSGATTGLTAPEGGRKAPAEDPATLEQRIAELEAAFADCDDDWEPDGSESLAAAKGWVVAGSGAVSAAVPDRDDVDRPAQTDAAGPSPEASQARAAAADTGPEEAMLLDEDALRDLVTDIVRQELQGRLGERITLNVRKLVRREINRALALRDIE